MTDLVTTSDTKQSVCSDVVINEMKFVSPNIRLFSFGSYQFGGRGRRVSGTSRDSGSFDQSELLTTHQTGREAPLALSSGPSGACVYLT